MISDWSPWETQFLSFVRNGAQSADVAHDLEHIHRVVGNARTIAAAEGGLLEIVVPAAWLHDCVVLPKDSGERASGSRLAAEAATAFLKEIGYPAEYLAGIAHAIEAHSFSANIPPESLEARIVQDADRLDAIGAIGIARCLMLGGALGKPLYNVEEPLPQVRAPDESRYVVDHFYEKLLQLAEMMTTETGRREAARRTAFMREYLAHLDHERVGKWYDSSESRPGPLFSFSQ
jgi:uncharacterized protein